MKNTIELLGKKDYVLWSDSNWVDPLENVTRYLAD